MQDHTKVLAELIEGECHFWNWTSLHRALEVAKALTAGLGKHFSVVSIRPEYWNVVGPDFLGLT